jgi:hypothetical protein
LSFVKERLLSIYMDCTISKTEIKVVLKHRYFVVVVVVLQGNTIMTFLFIYSYVHTFLGHSSLPHPLLLPGRIISNFVEEKI